MGEPITFRTKGWVNTNLTLRGFVRDDQTGVAMLPTACTALSYTVTEATGTNPGRVTTASLAPVGTYILSGVTTVGWTVDTIGYNFQATLPAAAFPDSGEYVIDIVGTLASDGSTFILAKCFHNANSRS